jgi:hypothetical protein
VLQRRQPRESPEPQWSLQDRAIFFFLPVDPFSSERVGTRIASERRLQSRWTWSIPPLVPRWDDHRGDGSRAVDHRLDEPRQIIPQRLRPRSARLRFIWRSYCRSIQLTRSDLWKSDLLACLTLPTPMLWA